MIWGTAVSRVQLLEMTRSLIAHAQAGTIDQAPSVARIPVSAYTDPALFELEKKRIFRRLPLMLAPACELPEPGSYKAMTVVGVPVLLTRQKDGSVAAFLNMCSHRGNPLASGEGKASRFVCGYHGWTFRNDGALLGVVSDKCLRKNYLFGLCRYAHWPRRSAPRRNR